MRSHFGRDLFLDPHAVRVHDVDDPRRIIDDAQVRDSNIEAAKLVIVPDRVGRPCNRYSRLFLPAGEIERHHGAPIAGHKRPAAFLVEVQPMRARTPDGELLNQRKRICREHGHASRFANIDQKVVSCLVIDRPPWSTWKLHLRRYLASLRVDQSCLVLLDIGHQQVLPVWVPGQAVGARPDRNCSQDGIRRGIDHQELARAARRREDQRVALGTENPTGLRAAGNGRQVAQTLSIDDLDSACRRIGDETRPLWR